MVFVLVNEKSASVCVSLARQEPVTVSTDCFPLIAFQIINTKPTLNLLPPSQLTKSGSKGTCLHYLPFSNDYYVFKTIRQ
jgi:hypothetical protein